METVFRETFTTPFDQYSERKGQAFKVIRKLTEPDDDHDEEVLPMYIIEFLDGVQIEAFPDEVEVL